MSTAYGTVLVIDDEPTVGAVLSRILRGHMVTVVARGSDALELLGAWSGYDVILCDITMPEISGIDLHRLVLEQFPEAARRMVFVTGGAFTPEACEFLDEVPNERISKPFDMGHVRTLVSRYVTSSAPRCA